MLKARDHLLLPRYKRRGSFQLNQRLTQAVNDRRAARANQVDARESAAAQLRGEQADPAQAASGAAEPAASPVPVTARAAASLVEDASPAAAYPQEAAPVQDASAIPSPRQWSAGGAGHRRRRGHTPDRAPTCAERSAAAAARSGNAEPAQLLTNPRAARSRGRTRKCPVCGKTVREGTRYCPGCDTPIHWDREL